MSRTAREGSPAFVFSRVRTRTYIYNKVYSAVESFFC